MTTCTCISDFNKRLEQHNTRIVQASLRIDGNWVERPTIHREQIETGRGKKKAVTVVPSFCPFCGFRYSGKAEPTLPKLDTADRYEEALQLVREHRKPSVSFVQRHLHIGYNQASRYVERMQAEGLVSLPNNTGARSWIGGAV